MTATSKDSWDKITAIGAICSGVLIPLAVAFAGFYFSQSMKDSENRLKYIEIAASVVRDEPKPENQALRVWAVDVLTHYSKDVPLSSEAQRALKERKQEIYASGWGNSTAYATMTSFPKDKVPQDK
jgi:hypothetical protein